MRTQARNATIRRMPGGDSVMDFDSELCRESVGHRAFRLRHRLAGHPLLSPERIALLAGRLPAQALDCSATDGPGSRRRPLPRIPEIIFKCEKHRNWMLVWNVEQVPEYHELCQEVLADLVPSMPAWAAQLGLRQVRLVLTSPTRATPPRIDPDHALVMQVIGSRQLGVGRLSSRPGERHDKEHPGGHANGQRSSHLHRSEIHCLQPGDAVYLPPWQPRFSANDSAMALWLSVGFQARSTFQ